MMKVYDYSLIPMNLQLFGDGPGGEKTEKATPRKKKEKLEKTVKSQKVMRLPRHLF